MNEQLSYVTENLPRFIEELKEFLRIASISADSAYDEQTRRGAMYVAAEAARIGLENVAIMETSRHPVVYADWLHAKGAPTVLIYGHYDVQPPDPLDLWTTPPFEPTIRGDEIFARGAIDDKGQVHLHLKSLESWLATIGRLPVNVKLVIEGEEEIGSPNLQTFLARHRDLLKCDAVVISDTTMYDYGMPSVTYGLRGLAYFEISVTGPDRDLHSGMFGGAVANPINALCELIARMKDADGRIALPGFYDRVVDVTPEEHAELARLPWDREKFKSMLSITDVSGEPGYTDIERMWARPTLDVCGIWGGYQGEGAKTVLPSAAGAKVSMRLVAHQDHTAIGDMLRQFVDENLPSGVTARITDLHGGPPALTPTDSAPVRAALRALQSAFGTSPFLIRSGGSIPIVADFSELLGAPVVLMGFGLPDQNAHSPDEKMNLKMYDLGIRSAVMFLSELADNQGT